MPIALEDSGFYEWHEPINPVPALGIDSARIDETIACYHERPFRGLFGHKGFGFDQKNLDFLPEVSNAIYLWLWDIALDNIDGVYSLCELTHMGIHPKRPGIDFSRLPALRNVVNYWTKADTGISEATAIDYTLWRFKPRSKSFEGVEIPAGVKRLEFNWANPISLDGLPTLKNVKRLEIHYSRNLVDLSALPSIAPNLESLSIHSSKRVEPKQGVLDHPTLRSAFINDEVIIDGRR